MLEPSICKSSTLTVIRVEWQVASESQNQESIQKILKERLYTRETQVGGMDTKYMHIYFERCWRHYTSIEAMIQARNHAKHRKEFSLSFSVFRKGSYSKLSLSTAFYAVFLALWTHWKTY